MSGITLRCAYCGRPVVGAAVYGGNAEPYHVECTQSPQVEHAGWAPADGMIRLVLDHNEAQAILNSLHESGVLDQPMIFHHVDTLRRKTERAMTAAGFPPLTHK